MFLAVCFFLTQVPDVETRTVEIKVTLSEGVIDASRLKIDVESGDVHYALQPEIKSDGTLRVELPVDEMAWIIFRYPEMKRVRFFMEMDRVEPLAAELCMAPKRSDTRMRSIENMELWCALENWRHCQGLIEDDHKLEEGKACLQSILEALPELWQRHVVRSYADGWMESINQARDFDPAAEVVAAVDQGVYAISEDRRILIEYARGRCGEPVDVPCELRVFEQHLTQMNIGDRKSIMGRSFHLALSAGDRKTAQAFLKRLESEYPRSIHTTNARSALDGKEVE